MDYARVLTQDEEAAYESTAPPSTEVFRPESEYAVVKQEEGNAAFLESTEETQGAPFRPVHRNEPKFYISWRAAFCLRS